MLQRPFICYADFECSITTKKDPNKIAKHVPNSAMFYVVCTYDDSNNKLCKLEGEDCYIKMIVTEYPQIKEDITAENPSGYVSFILFHFYCVAYTKCNVCFF